MSKNEASNTIIVQACRERQGRKMTTAFFQKTLAGLSPADAISAKALERVKLGEMVKVEFVRPRNVKFHRKLFALLNLAFDAWDPDAEHQGRQVQKNFERFRADVTILAGHYDVVARLGGDVRAVPKSISFAKMSDEEFEAFYSSVLDVVLQRVLTNYTRDDLDQVVEQVLGFSG